MEGQADDNIGNAEPADAGLIERLGKINALIDELNTELTRLENEGAEISHQLLGLVDKAKTEKIKQFISKQPE